LNSRYGCRQLLDKSQTSVYNHYERPTNHQIEAALY
jgi:hypothetical protein